jgi:hypothetical protein
MGSIKRRQGHPSTEIGRSQMSLGASAAVSAACSSIDTRQAPSHFPRRASTDAGRIYVEAVLDRYLWLPGTPTRISRHDRQLARTLYERGVPLPALRAALTLGAARRAFRSQDAPKLPPIRTLHYFLPVLEEILELPPDEGYLEYLEAKLVPLADAKAGSSRAVRSG